MRYCGTLADVTDLTLPGVQKPINTEERASTHPHMHASTHVLISVLCLLSCSTLADVTGPTLPGVQQPINTEEPLRTLRPLPGFDIGPRVMRGPGFDSQMAALELEARKKAESASLGDMVSVECVCVWRM